MNMEFLKIPTYMAPVLSGASPFPWCPKHVLAEWLIQPCIYYNYKEGSVLTFAYVSVGWMFGC